MRNISEFSEAPEYIRRRNFTFLVLSDCIVTNTTLSWIFSCKLLLYLFSEVCIFGLLLFLSSSGMLLIRVCCLHLQIIYLEIPCFSMIKGK